MFACSKLGVYFTLFNYAYTASELLCALEATTPKVLLTTLTTSRFDYTPVLEGLHSAVAGLEQIILLEDVSQPSQLLPTATGFITYQDVIARGSQSKFELRFLEEVISDNDILNLQFTSGSTGLPKTAALTHHGMVNSARYIGLQMGIKASDRINVPVPLFHAFGLIIGWLFPHHIGIC